MTTDNDNVESAACNLDVMILGSSDDTYIAISSVRVVNSQLHDCCLVPTRQLTH